MIDNPLPSSKALWAAFYRAEESLYEYVTSQVTEVQEYGRHCSPLITPLIYEDGRMNSFRPKHVRWIGSVEGDHALLKNIELKAAKVRQLYLDAKPKAERYPRDIMFLPECWKLVVNTNEAFSSHIIRNVEHLVLASECIKVEHYAEQIIQYRELLASLIRNDFTSAEVHYNPATISITVKTTDIIQHFGRDDLVYRVPSGIQYRMRVDEGTHSFQTKLGFVICLNTPIIAQPSSYRKGRGDKYSTVSEPLPFPEDIKGQFWVQK